MKNRVDESVSRGNETSEMAIVISQVKILRTGTKKYQRVERFKKHLKAGRGGLGEGLDVKGEGAGGD